MDKIKAILHGTSVEEEREKKEEKKLEKEGHSGEGSHLGSSTHNTTSHTSNVNPTPAGVAGTTGGLGHNTMKSDYNSTPHDGNLTTHDRHAEREANIGAGGVDLPHRPRDSEHTTGHTSGLGGVGNGSNITGPNTQVHGINSATGTSEAGLASQEARGPLSSHAVGNTESHHGRDAALGSGAAAGAAGLAHHEHGQHHTTHDNQGLGSGVSGTHQSHTGRDAALGTGAAAGAAGLAHHEHGQHHNTHDSHGLGSGVGGPHTTTTANLLDPKVNPTGPLESAHKHHGHSGRVEGGGAEDADGDHGALGTSAGAGILGKRDFEAGHTGTTTAGPHSSNLANKADPRVDSDLSKSQGHHYGRDAAIAGGLGAAGATAYGAGHHDNTTAGPHSSNLGNKADPRVDSDLSRNQDHHLGRDAALAGGVGAAGLGASHGHNTTTAGPHSSNIANKADPRVDSDLSRNQDHHLGRDAALAGGVGAAGLGAHQAGHSTHQNPNTLSSGNTGYGNTTAGPHSSNLANKADPRVDSDRSKDHHYGRDAAVAGGVGAAGYEANKHLGHNDSTTHSNTTAGPHSSNLANKADPRVDSDRSQDHHYGRDAALTGGAGGAAYEANKHLGHNNNTHTTHGPTTTTSGPHDSNLANKADPRVDSDRSKDHHYGRDAALAGGAGGAAYEANKHLGHNNNTHTTNAPTTTTTANTTAGPHDSNLANKADPRVDSDRSKDHHYGRDAALAGGAAYEANKHLGHNNNTHTTHGPTNTTTSTTAGPHDSNLANKADPRVDSDRSKDHHYGRDAALAGGAGGAAYEANKHLGHDNNTHLNKTPLDQKPPGKDLGDHLHGVERNRGVPGDTGFPHSEGHHHGSTSSGTTGLASQRDPAVGTGVPGAPRGNVLKGEHQHHHGHEHAHDVQHNNGGLAGPEHLITAPVMNDPKANHDLVGAEHGHGHGHGHATEHGVGHTTEHGVGHHEHGLGTSTHGHEHGQTGGLATGAHGHTAESQQYGAGTTGSHVPGTTGTTGTTGVAHGDRVL